MSKNKGFTLIELVMVIVILGILAAVAIPRFIDLSSDASKATARGVAGSIIGSANMLHAQYLLHTSTTYILGNGSTNGTDIIGNSNISGGATALAAPTNIGPPTGGSALITITVNNTPYTMTFTVDANGPRALYSF